MHVFTRIIVQVVSIIPICKLLKYYQKVISKLQLYFKQWSTPMKYIFVMNIAYIQFSATLCIFIKITWIRYVSCLRFRISFIYQYYHQLIAFLKELILTVQKWIYFHYFVLSCELINLNLIESNAVVVMN